MEENTTAESYTMDHSPHFTTSPSDHVTPRALSRSPGRAYSRQNRNFTPYPRPQAGAQSPPHQSRSPPRRSTAQSGAPHRSSSYRRTSRTSPYSQPPPSPTRRSTVNIAADSYMLYDAPPICEQALLPDSSPRKPSPPPARSDAWSAIPKLRATGVRPAVSFTYTTAFFAEHPLPGLPTPRMPGSFPESPQVAAPSSPKLVDDTHDSPEIEAQLPQIRTRIVSIKKLAPDPLARAYNNPQPFANQLPGTGDDHLYVVDPKREFTFQLELAQPTSSETGGSEVPSSTLRSERSYKYNTKKSYAEIERDADNHPLPQWEPEHLTRSPTGGAAVAERRTVYERMVALARKEEERRVRRT
ncbi:hypothetical protein TI39_contig364g00015 [Zymoseptoria brevis]|uniref:Uncharacterized protein n=1 Tax=Zymoseptoria brevis TaxID=1047168 RepID=A0A0F4GPE9_9PEZI|nr:hypothetical protein TI39_contig364g00015 [Zymoseptoria brevis]